MAKSMTDLPCHLSQKPDPRSNGLIGRKQPETLRHKIADKGGSSSDCTHLSSPTEAEAGGSAVSRGLRSSVSIAGGIGLQCTEPAKWSALRPLSIHTGHLTLFLHKEETWSVSPHLKQHDLLSFGSVQRCNV
ncbi:uncharacterized protein [Linepithema humile]|uniref:uncharacterized protein isoform X1 n=1 Tax=Linepithema humile TaxID=83485 RepID=UPI00351E303B